MIRRVVEAVVLAAVLAVAFAAVARVSYTWGVAAGMRTALRSMGGAPHFDNLPDQQEIRYMPIPDRMRSAAEAAARRARTGQSLGHPDVLAGAFPQQRACVLDPAPFKAEFCTRRAAKTYTWGLEAVNDSFSHPRANYLFLGLVRTEARRIFWKDVLQDLDDRYKLGMHYNESRLEAVMPNGATIYIGAADANKEEMRKLLGGKYRKVGIDEAQDWQHTDLNALVFETLKPALADWRGSVTIMGTPGRVTKGLFYDVTQKRTGGWSLHQWTTFDNPYMVEQWKDEIADLKARFPGIEETPAFQRNYLGKWVIDDSSLVYRYRPGVNDFDELPEHLLAHGWHFVLGVDLGYNDDTAFALVAYHMNHPALFIIEAYKQKGMDITMVADKIKWYLGRHRIETTVIDGSNKQAVAEMQNRHGLSLTPSDKTGKSDFIELMNAEFTTKRILVNPIAARPLVDEWGGLVWADKATKREEHPACPNHACDAALYAWRYTYGYASRPTETAPVPGSQAWAEAEGLKMLDRARTKVEQAKLAQAEQFGPVEVDLDDKTGGWGTGYDWGS